MAQLSTWWRKFRIVPDRYAGYEVQTWYIWWPFYTEYRINTWATVECATEYAEYLANKHIIYL